MTHYVAIVEESGPETAVGVWFPDLPGCFSAGDNVDEAILNAAEAIALYAEGLSDQGKALPSPRSLSVLRHDPALKAELHEHMVALIPYGAGAAAAAE